MSTTSTFLEPSPNLVLHGEEPAEIISRSEGLTLKHLKTGTVVVVPDSEARTLAPYVVPRREGYTQVCVWPSTTLGDGTPEDFEKFIAEEYQGTRAQFLEIIITGSGGRRGDGGRHDLFFAVHREDLSKFSVPRLMAGIRWIEDVLAPINYVRPIYPDRVQLYKSWDAGGQSDRQEEEE